MPQFETLYAPYIWAVYGLALLLLGGMVLVTLLKARNAKRAHDAITRTEKATK